MPDPIILVCSTNSEHGAGHPGHLRGAGCQWRPVQYCAGGTKPLQRQSGHGLEKRLPICSYLKLLVTFQFLTIQLKLFNSVASRKSSRVE